MPTYIYPKLPAVKTFPFFRIGGNGLANCLFIYARAIVLAKKYNAPIITPTWFNLSIGTYIRQQKDKRHYLGIFKKGEETSGYKKFMILLTMNKSKENRIHYTGVIEVAGLSHYFLDIIHDYALVRDYIYEHLNRKIIDPVDKYDFSNCVGVHIRLGDYRKELRIPMEWYEKKIKAINHNKKILIFSDGSDEELNTVLSLPRVERAFFGNAMSDILALSKCEFIIGSDSTFSGWGCYLGQVPCCFYRKHFGPVLKDQSQEFVENTCVNLSL